MRLVLILAVCAWATNPFTGRVPVRTDNTQVGADIASMPVTFDTTIAALATVANGGQATDDSGYSVVPYKDANAVNQDTFQLEYYNKTTGHIIMHILMHPHSATTDSVYLQVGNASITTNQGSTATWDTGFRGVFPFRDGTNLNVGDVSTYGNASTNHGTTPIAGENDGGASFTSTAQYIDLGNNYCWELAHPYTIDVWWKNNGAAGGANALSHQDNSSPYHGYGLQITANKEDFFLYNGTSCDFGWGTANGDSTYHHIVIINKGGGATCVLDSGSFLVYDNGVKQTKIWSSTAYTGTMCSAVSMQVNGRGGANNGVAGKMDLPRFSSVARDTNLVKLEYASEKKGQNFWILGSYTANTTTGCSQSFLGINGVPTASIAGVNGVPCTSVKGVNGVP